MNKQWSTGQIAPDPFSPHEKRKATATGPAGDGGPEGAGLLNKVSNMLRRVSGRVVQPLGGPHDGGGGGSGRELMKKQDWGGSSKGQSSAASAHDGDRDRLRALEAKYAQLKGTVGRCVENVKAPVSKMETELDELRKLLDVLSTHAKLSRPSRLIGARADDEGKIPLTADEYDRLLDHTRVLKAYANAQAMVVTRVTNFLQGTTENDCDHGPMPVPVNVRSMLQRQMNTIRVLYDGVEVTLESVMLPKQASRIVTDRTWLAESALSLLAIAAQNARTAVGEPSSSSKRTGRSSGGGTVARRDDLIKIRMRCLLVDAVTSEPVAGGRPDKEADGNAASYHVRFEVDDDYVHVPPTFQKEIYSGPDDILSSVLSKDPDRSADFAMALQTLQARCAKLGGRCGARDVLLRVSTKRTARGTCEEICGTCFWFEVPYVRAEGTAAEPGSSSPESSTYYSDRQRAAGSLRRQPSPRLGPPASVSGAAAAAGDGHDKHGGGGGKAPSGRGVPVGSNDDALTDMSVEETAPGRGLSVLVIDNTQSVLNIIGAVLEAKGYQVKTASLGLQALKMVKRWGTKVDEDYDFVLMRVGPKEQLRKQKLVVSKMHERLSEMTALQRCASVDSWNASASVQSAAVGSNKPGGGRAAGHRFAVPVIGMVGGWGADDADTGEGSSPDMMHREAVAFGVDAVVRKPFGSDYLAGVLLAVMQQRQAGTWSNGSNPPTRAHTAHNTPPISRQTSRPRAIGGSSAVSTPSHPTGKRHHSRADMAAEIVVTEAPRRVSKPSDGGGVGALVRCLVPVLSDDQLEPLVGSLPTHLIPVVVPQLTREVPPSTFIAVLRCIDPALLPSLTLTLPPHRIPATLSMLPADVWPSVYVKLPVSAVAEIVPSLTNDQLDALLPFVPTTDVMVAVAARCSPDKLVATVEHLSQDFLVAVLVHGGPRPTDTTKAQLLAALPQERLTTVVSAVLSLDPPPTDMLLAVVPRVQDENCTCHIVPLLPDDLVEALMPSLTPSTLMLLMPRLPPHLLPTAYTSIRYHGAEPPPS